MEKVQLVAGWSSYYTLTGVRLVNGEIVKIKFPNNKTVKRELKIKIAEYISGNHDVSTEDIVYFEMMVNKVPARIYLRDNLDFLLFERVSAPKSKSNKSTIKK